MTASQKLDFLMNITNTSNITLAHYCKLDASMISLLRNGKRRLSSKASYLPNISNYFALRCRKSNVNETLALITGMPIFNTEADDEAIAAAITFWLLNEQITAFTETANPLPAARQASETQLIHPFFGNVGRRNALKLFKDAVSLYDSGTLYISSDESFNWLLEDPMLSAEIEKHMQRMSVKNFRIVCIQNPLINIDYAIDVIRKWLALICNATVSFYYFPHFRDVFYRRTLFIFDEHIAFFSNSISQAGESRLTLLTTDKTIIGSLKAEFGDYVSLCRPSYRQTLSSDLDDYLLELASIYTQSEAAVIASSRNLPLASMPPQLVDRQRPQSKSHFIQRQLLALRGHMPRIEAALANRKYTDLISLPSPEDVLSGRVLNYWLSYICNEKIYYSPGSFRLHLGNVLQWLERYPNYYIAVRRDAVPECYENVLCQDNSVAILFRNTVPYGIFNVLDNTIANALWEYFQHALRDDSSILTDRAQCIGLLQTLMEQLEMPGL